MDSKKIMIIEDDKFFRDLVSQKITQGGFDVVEAFDAKKGLEMLPVERPSLILLDLILPGMDGFEFLEKIKADDQFKTIPVIILSNLGQKEEIERGIRLGAEDFLVKVNFTPDEVAEKIREVFQKKYV